MSLSPSKHLVLITAFTLMGVGLNAGDGFPAWDNPNVFKQDLIRATLATNLPNVTEADHFLGAELSGAQIYSNSGSYQYIPAGRLSIYPNPDYNLWVQFARWPGSDPNYAVGTGVQVAFKGEADTRRQAIGISWHSIFAETFMQRDVSVHGLYGTTWKGMNMGLIAMVDIHHILVEDGNGIPDYDKTILIAVPYISRVMGDAFRITLKLPYNSTGFGIALGGELLIRKRQ